jgi:hypothetical protein
MPGSVEQSMLHELGAKSLTERAGTRTHALKARPGTYVIEVSSKLDRAAVNHAIDAIYRHAGPGGPQRVLFWEAGPDVDYDRDVLGYYENSPHKDGPQPAEVAVVTNSRAIRMVVAATAIGFRLMTGRRLKVYASLPEALTEPPA